MGYGTGYGIGMDAPASLMKPGVVGGVRNESPPFFPSQPHTYSSPLGYEMLLFYFMMTMMTICFLLLFAFGNFFLNGGLF